MSGSLDDLIEYLESSRPGFLQRLSSDPLSPLVLVIGSWARREAGPLSDVDLLVVTKSHELAAINALHCFEGEVPSVDISFVGEEAFHNGTLSAYERKSLLRHHEVMFSRCSSCADALVRTRDEIDLRPDLAEIQSLLWHLMHIRSKYAAAANPELREVLRAKFIYYFPHVYVQATGCDALGEGPAVREILANPEVGRYFRSLTVSRDLTEVARVMEVLIDRIADQCAVDDRRFLVEKKDFILPIRQSSEDVADVDMATAWGRGLFGGLTTGATLDASRSELTL